MHRKCLLSLTAIVTAFSLIAGNTVTAFANDDVTTTPIVNESHTGDIEVTDGKTAVIANEENKEITIAGNIDVSGTTSNTYDEGDVAVNHNNGGTGVFVGQGADVAVTGDIRVHDGGRGITASGSGSSINVTGTVEASDSAVDYLVSDGTPVRYDSSTGASINSGATANVTKDVIGGGTGASIHGDSKLEVGGDVKATGTDSTYYTKNPETGKYDIKHNSVGGKGITSDGNAAIIVKGNVTGLDLGILMNPDDDDKAGVLIVEGTISSSSQGIQISKPGTSDSDSGIDYDSIEDFMDDVPEIIVGSINAPLPVNGSADIKDEEGKADYTRLNQQLISAINYIINIDEASKNAYSITTSGENIENRHGYDTVNLNEAFNVAASLPAGYTISGGNNVSVQDNGNGSFTLTLKSVNGGILIKAMLIPVENKNTGDTEYKVVNVVDNTEAQTPAPAPATSDDIPAGAVTITPVVAVPAANGTVPTSPISGDKVARSVALDLGKVTPVQYRQVVIDNVAAAPKGGALNIETDRVSFFDRNMIAKIATRSDIDVNVVFTYLGRRIKVTIPAGYNVASLLDENGYCGYLRLLHLLGGTDL